MLDRAALIALNHLLQGATWARARLAPFAGRAARLSLPPFRLDFAVTADGTLTTLTTVGKEIPDVEIALPADTPLLLFQGSEAVARATRISGSAEFADALGFVLRELRWDFEEDLSKPLGDIAAHRIAAQLKAFGAWHRQAARNLAENFTEYLTEEQPLLAKSAAVKAFPGKVQQLHADLAQLEQRVARLGA
ncbi:MAG: hypothetical protein HY066_17005 [Betaproteobacteria bacterium]|nr:hypothetical protein [Betaproteobacteria bacterium]